MEAAEEAAWLTPLEVTGAVPWETADATPFRVLVTVPVTALVTAPSRPPDEPGLTVAVAVRLVVEAWALVPDSSQNTAIRPKQQPRSTVPRMANRPAQPWPGITCASGAA